MPEAKKTIMEPAARWLQRLASAASNCTSPGTCTVRGEAPDADRAVDRVDFGRHRGAVADGGAAVAGQDGGDLQRIGFEPRARGAARDFRQQNGGEHCDDGEDADDFDEGEAALAGAVFSGPS